MVLTSPRFVSVSECQKAAVNAPPIKFGMINEGVRAVQQGLLDLKFPLPVSTAKTGKPDGKFGQETQGAVIKFQKGNGLVADGIVGAKTMDKLDKALPGGGTPTVTGLPYTVPFFRVPIAQPTSMVCWATVHCMMRSWKQQQSLDIRQAAGQVDEKYGVMVDKNQGMPPSEFGTFIKLAGMDLQPMANLTIQGWLDLLMNKGLLWVGTLNSIGPGAGLHSRIVEGMRGDGSATGTFMDIMDPDGGKRYQEQFDIFLAKYEGAFILAGSDYYQIRHFL
jgi:hypothetical protein